jgi:hypothetical protein
VVCLAERGTKLPFDIATERTIFYDNDMAGVEILKPKLAKAIQEAVEEVEPDNPIYRVVTDSIMREVAAKDDAQSYIIKRLNEITSQLNRLRHSVDGNTPRRTTRLIVTVSKNGEMLVADEVVDHILSQSNVASISVPGKEESDRLRLELLILGGVREAEKVLSDLVVEGYELDNIGMY